MSSHHIIREKQEPALLVLELDNFPEEMLGQLLEWSPTVITTPHTAEVLNTLGIKVDWIIADNNNTDLQSDVKIMPAGNNTPAGAALAYLVENNYPAVNIITTGTALDELLPFAGKINLVIINARQKIYTVTTGFSKWKPAGEQIDLLSTTNTLHYNGLQQTAVNSYQTTHDGFFTLQFDEPFIIIAEQL